MRAAILLALLVACSGPDYTYTFRVGGPTGDRDVTAELVVDARAGAIDLALTNHTDAEVQVRWADVALARPDGSVVALRPDADLGWIKPGARVAARLFPFVLPRGDGAAAYEGRAFRLDVPAIVRRENKVYRFDLVAHVRKS